MLPLFSVRIHVGDFLLTESPATILCFREFIQLPDGGQVSLDWYTDPPSRTSSPASPSDQPIALFIPGLTGDSQTEYIKSLIPHAQSCGYRYYLLESLSIARCELIASCGAGALPSTTGEEVG